MGGGIKDQNPIALSVVSCQRGDETDPPLAQHLALVVDQHEVALMAQVSLDRRAGRRQLQRRVVPRKALDGGRLPGLVEQPLT